MTTDRPEPDEHELRLEAKAVESPWRFPPAGPASTAGPEDADRGAEPATVTVTGASQVHSPDILSFPGSASTGPSLAAFMDRLAAVAAPGPSPTATNTAVGRWASPPDPAGPVIPYPVIPGYEVLAKLGRGGMGAVYEARQAPVHGSGASPGCEDRGAPGGRVRALGRSCTSA